MKIPEGAVLHADGPDGQHWRESLDVITPGGNSFIFKCKHCGLVSYANDPVSHKAPCNHPYYIDLEDLL